MTRRMHLKALTVLCMAAIGAPATGQELPTPGAYYDAAIRGIESHITDGNVTGEGFCWHAAFSQGGFVRAYKVTSDTEWLDYAVKYFDTLVSVMATGPDGYKGWIGPFIYDRSVWCDVHVGDALMVEGMLGFAELVLKDPDLAIRYGETARGYVKIAERDVIEKWDARGTWREDGAYGAYASWDRYGEPGDFTNWTLRPDVAPTKSNLSLPFNKNNHMGTVLLRLYRITGQQAYRDKAERIFAFMRSRFQLFNDHYVWNYWEPFGPWDFNEDGNGTRHWIGVHPYRDYQAGEIGQIVEAYHTGVVFSKADIERIINTNLKVMWNGNRENPEFRNSNATIPGYTKPRPSQAYPGSAGTLWTALADFSQTVRDLHADRLTGPMNSRQAIDAAYFRTVTCAAAPGFDRKYVENPDTMPPLPEIDTGESAELLVAAVMPTVIQRGRDSYMICSAYLSGSIRIDLYSADGKTRVAELYSGPFRRPLIRTFNGVTPDGRAVPAGNYRIRWSFNDGYRDSAIKITP